MVLLALLAEFNAVSGRLLHKMVLELQFEKAHDCHLQQFYQAHYADYSPRSYAVGITTDISDQSLRAIVNDPAAL